MFSGVQITNCVAIVQAPHQQGSAYRGNNSANATPAKVIECLQKQFAAHGTV
jgi:hypothetical protein